MQKTFVQRFNRAGESLLGIPREQADSFTARDRQVLLLQKPLTRNVLARRVRSILDSEQLPAQ